MKKFRHLCQYVLMIALAVVFAACTQTPAVKKRYFWPPGDPRPRIEYINFYQVEQDIRRDVKSWAEDYILGKERPRYAFSQPYGIVSDGHGKVYVSDISKERIFIYDFTAKEVRALKDSPQRNRMLDAVNLNAEGEFVERAWGLDVDAQGQLYAALSRRGEIAIFGADETLKALIGKGILQNPVGVAVEPHRGDLLVADTKLHQVLRFATDGSLLGSYGQRGAEPGNFNSPIDIDVDATGTIYVLDSLNARVQVFDSEMRYLRSFGERGTASGSFMLAKCLAVSSEGYVYVSDALAHRVVVFDREGNYLLTFGGKSFVTDSVAPGGFYMPAGIDADANDTIWIADSLNRMFHQFQYVSDRYLAEHPVLPGQAVLPQVFFDKNQKDGANPAPVAQ